LYHASANVGLARVAARNAASTFRPEARSMLPRLNGGAASGGIAFHHDPVEARVDDVYFAVFSNLLDPAVQNALA